ncbi:hypothetical protein ACN2WE_00355 [Streptomyces sp. cg28]|uniref:hypothetical protein n=1 Tax=Streptomyces sp. cg28 TaxID=3403457 RepID=UPI003B21D799
MDPALQGFTVSHHRTALVAMVLSGLMLTACSSGAAARPETGRQTVLDRLNEADHSPYSAALDAVTRSGTRRLQHMTGRINLGAPLTGRTTDKTEQYTEDVVMTRKHVYRRAVGTHGEWQIFSAAVAKGGIPTDRLPQYTRLILDHNGTVHQGTEPLRVSGRLTPKDIEKVDKTTGRNLRPATSIDADVWLDKKGRIVRVRQVIHLPSQPTVHNTLSLTDFKQPISVRVPGAS